MHRLLWALAIAAMATGGAGKALAQTSGEMPGTVVSTNGAENVKLVGRDVVPKVGKPVGKPVNLPTGPNMKPYNPANPFESLTGANLNPSSVVAPVNGYTAEATPGTFQSVVNSLKSLVGLNTKPTIARLPYTPGIYRRDRERVKERMFDRD